MKIELDLPNYATKADSKNSTVVDTSNFPKKFDLARLKSETDKLDIGKLETTPVDLIDVVKNEVVKKTVYDKLIKKVNVIQTSDTSNLVQKADYNGNIPEIEKKIFDHDHGKYITTQEFNKLTAVDFAARLAKVKLATKADIADIVKKTDFDEK